MRTAVPGMHLQVLLTMAILSHTRTRLLAKSSGAIAVQTLHIISKGTGQTKRSKVVSIDSSPFQELAPRLLPIFIKGPLRKLQNIVTVHILICIIGAF